jgi:hypothetical protein
MRVDIFVPLLLLRANAQLKPSLIRLLVAGLSSVAACIFLYLD